MLIVFFVKTLSVNFSNCLFSVFLFLSNLLQFDWNSSQGYKRNSQSVDAGTWNGYIAKQIACLNVEQFISDFGRFIYLCRKKTWQKILNTVRKRVSQLDFCLLYFKCFGRVKFWMPKNFGRFIFGRLFCKTVTIHRIIDEQRC